MRSQVRKTPSGGNGNPLHWGHGSIVIVEAVFFQGVNNIIGDIIYETLVGLPYISQERYFSL